MAEHAGRQRKRREKRHVSVDTWEEKKEGGGNVSVCAFLSLPFNMCCELPWKSCSAFTFSVDTMRSWWLQRWWRSTQQHILLLLLHHHLKLTSPPNHLLQQRNTGFRFWESGRVLSGRHESMHGINLYSWLEDGTFVPATGHRKKTSAHWSL